MRNTVTELSTNVPCSDSRSDDFRSILLSVCKSIFAKLFIYLFFFLFYLETSKFSTIMLQKSETKLIKEVLALVLLNPDTPCLYKQCRSRSVGF